jgi:hypothetical protein
MEEGGKVVIVREASQGPYDAEEVKMALKLVAGALHAGGVDWRAPCNRNGVVGYGSLLARLPPRQPPSRLLDDLLARYLSSDVQPKTLQDILDDGLCSLARGSMMVEVKAGPDRVVASLHWVLSKAQAILELGRQGAPILVVEGRGSTARGEAVELWEAWKASQGDAKCGRLVRALYRDVARIAGSVDGALRVSFAARSGSYAKGLGLLLPEEGERCGGG